jgi:hypothetical protein
MPILPSGNNLTSNQARIAARWRYIESQRLYSHLIGIVSVASEVVLKNSMSPRTWIENQSIDIASSVLVFSIGLVATASSRASSRYRIAKCRVRLEPNLGGL